MERWWRYWRRNVEGKTAGKEEELREEVMDEVLRRPLRGKIRKLMEGEAADGQTQVEEKKYDEKDEVSGRTQDSPMSQTCSLL